MSAVCEFHPKPSGHFVMDQPTFDRVKAAALCPEPAPWMPAGQHSLFHGTPVYIDECPWDCRDEPTDLGAPLGQDQS